MLMSKNVTADPVSLKRTYESAAPGDGKRILIERLWPRGVKKTDPAVDLWLKDVAPSTALRKSVGHDLDPLRALARQGPVTLECSAHDEVHNDAAALRMLLLGHRTKPGDSADSP